MTHFILLLVKIIFYGTVFLTPILGGWLVSSLVAFTNGPFWLTVASSILFFPILPIIWELWAQRKRSQKRSPQPDILSWGDRLTLRTLCLNLIFISALLTLRPETAFLALSTRGDWMLDGQQGSQVEWFRQSLFKTAEGLEWLYSLNHQNPYRQASSTGVLPEALLRPSPQVSDAPTDWPWTGVGLHPAVVNMPRSVEVSIASVARYIAEQESDPFLRVKALHDYVADRIAYDTVAYFSGRIPDQDAELVFRARKGVCAGYAKLLEALGRAIGENIIYLSGDSRSRFGSLDGQGHAWNAAQINNHWYLIDATWDSGYVDGQTFVKEYETSYLFPPPKVMILSHLPDAPDWQLLEEPLSMGEFLRQPMLRPKFFAHGLELLSPQRSQSDVAQEAVISLNNPQGRWLMATYGRKESNQTEPCQTNTSQDGRLTCRLPRQGTYDVHLFSGQEQSGQYEFVGQLEFNRR